MEITDLSHDDAIPFNIGDIDRFRNVIILTRTVGPDYFPPNRNMIGGDLLDLNWKIYRTKTTKDMMAKADVFGLVFLRDLARIKKFPLIKIIVSSFNVPEAILRVKYFLIHLVQGEKKDSNFILEAFKPYLEQ